MKSSPLILKSLDDKGRHLIRSEVKAKDSTSEHWLQERLYDHPELLPVEDFDDIFAPPIPIGREIATGSGSLDNLYVSPDGGITIVETKLWKNPDKQRTVLAQVIDYAKELVTWDYEHLCEAILASSRSRGESEKASLEEKVSDALRDSDIALHEFQEGVATSLATGNFLLLIVGDRISPNIVLLSRAIQSAPGLDFTIGLVEMQLYQMSPGEDWPVVVVPEVVGRTVEKTRGVVKVEYKEEKPKVTVEVEDGGGDDLKIRSLEEFLEIVPRDLVATYKDGVDEWEKMGGTVRFTNRMMHFEATLNGELRRVVRFRKTQVKFVSLEDIKEWSSDETLYEKYCQSLEESPHILSLVRDGRQWENYGKMNAKDLKVLLRAARELVQNIKAEE
ncbi:MAG: hypothetical protein DWQ31_11220 [Planctomycetota bacterium]|nr:MAG: hypothetical protein DWQ31_11220 [Planctomycetota bacterium]REJ94448.1 MAG: hypothetical protein DWQ35_08620 [Planctomycetota bacterium]REK22017.1 MAG: hypothetical protein DWQ42_17900 [Planctomycetota bacterium]REK44425.1 MAG: hypothetical protein DWQ46_09185 [Planctomycetota bacterium]